MWWGWWWWGWVVVRWGGGVMRWWPLSGPFTPHLFFGDLQLLWPILSHRASANTFIFSSCPSVGSVLSILSFSGSAWRIKRSICVLYWDKVGHPAFFGALSTMTGSFSFIAQQLRDLMKLIANITWKLTLISEWILFWESLYFHQVWVNCTVIGYRS